MSSYVPLGTCNFHRDWSVCQDKENAFLFVPIASTFYRSCKFLLAVSHEVGTVAAVDFTHILLIASAGHIFMTKAPLGMRKIGIPSLCYDEDFVTESLDVMGKDYGVFDKTFINLEHAVGVISQFNFPVWYLRS